MLSVKTQWAALPEAARAEWKGSFRKYKQQMFREMLNANQGGGGGKRERQAHDAPSPAQKAPVSWRNQLKARTGKPTRISLD